MTQPRSPRLKRGDPIRARFLNGQADQIDALRNQLTRLAAGSGTQAIDSAPDQSNLSPLQMIDPAVFAESLQQGIDAGRLDAGRVLQEIARLVSVVRVENPSDPAQFVDVERVEVVTFEDAAGERLTLVFDN